MFEILISFWVAPCFTFHCVVINALNGNPRATSNVATAYLLALVHYYKPQLAETLTHIQMSNPEKQSVENSQIILFNLLS